MQYWLMYHILYGPDIEIGELLLRAQREQFQAEGRGIPVRAEIIDSVQRSGESVVFPFLYEGTKYTDFQEAQYVLSSGAVTYDDVKRFWLFGDSSDDDHDGDDNGEDESGIECDTSYNLENDVDDESRGIQSNQSYDLESNNDECDGSYNLDSDEYNSEGQNINHASHANGSALLRNNHTVHLTPETQRLHQQLEQGREDGNALLNEKEITDSWKDISEAASFILRDKHCRRVDRDRLVSTMSAALDEYMRQRQERIGKRNNVNKSVYLGNSPAKGKLPIAKRKKGPCG